jgi:putative ABC transport system substrate-binding protein
MQKLLEVARAKGLPLEIQKAGTISEIDIAYAALVRLHVGPLIVASDLFLVSRREQLTALASRHAMPAIYPVREYVTAGGLISYGTSLTETYRQVGLLPRQDPCWCQVGQPAGQQSTKFELVINLSSQCTPCQPGARSTTFALAPYRGLSYHPGPAPPGGAANVWSPALPPWCC